MDRHPSLTWTPTLVPLAKREVLHKTRQRERFYEGKKVHGRTDYQGAEAC